MEYMTFGISLMTEPGIHWGVSLVGTLSQFTFTSGLVGYPSDDINKFLWIVRIGGGVFPHIKEADYLIFQKHFTLNYFEEVFTTHHGMVRIYKLNPRKNRIRVKTTKNAKMKSRTTSSSSTLTRKKSPWH